MIFKEFDFHIFLFHQMFRQLFIFHHNNDRPALISRQLVCRITAGKKFIVYEMLLLIFLLIEKLGCHIFQFQIFITVNRVGDDAAFGSITVIDQRRTGSIVQRIDIFENIIVGKFQDSTFHAVFKIIYIGKLSAVETACEGSDLRFQFRKITVRQGIFPAFVCVDIIGQTPGLIDRIDQIPHGNPLTFPCKVIHITGFGTWNDLFPAQGNSFINTVRGQGPLLHVVPDNVICIEVKEDIDGNIEKNSGKNKHADIQV